MPSVVKFDRSYVWGPEPRDAITFFQMRRPAGSFVKSAWKRFARENERLFAAKALKRRSRGFPFYDVLGNRALRFPFGLQLFRCLRRAGSDQFGTERRGRAGSSS